MPAIPLYTVTLLNIVIESFLYGVFLILNTSSLVLMIYPRHETPSGFRVPWSRRFKKALKKPMFIGATFLFIGVTGHWITTIMRIFIALTKYKEGIAPQEYYADVSQGIYTIKAVFLEMGLIAADAMLVYRLWLVYDKNYYIITAPLLTLLGLVVCSFGIVNKFAHYPPGQSIFSTGTEAWTVSDAVLSLVTNAYSTAMIAWRIFLTERRNESTGARFASSTSLKSVLAIFIESALLYTAWTIVFIAASAAESYIETIMASCCAVVAGISFSLINVRIGMGWAKISPTASASTSTSHMFRIDDPRQTTMHESPPPIQTPAVNHQVKNRTQSPPEIVSFPDDSLDCNRRDNQERAWNLFFSPTCEA